MIRSFPISLLLLAVLLGLARADDSLDQERWKRELSAADPARRAAAADAIAAIGTSARALGPELAKLTEDPDLKVRGAAFHALGAVRHRAALPRLVEEVAQAGPLWKRAVQALEQLPDSKAVPALRARLTESAGRKPNGFNDRVGELRALLHALAAIGPPARAAAPQVRVLVVDPQTPVVRQAAIRAWARLGPPKERQGLLRQAFAAHADAETRRAALEALGAQPGDPKTLNLLQHTLGDSEPFLATAAAGALATASPRGDKAARALLLAALREDRGPVSTAAARGLARLGARDPEVLQTLAKVAANLSRSDGESFASFEGDELHRACREAIASLRAQK